MIERGLFREEHVLFRGAVKKFIEREIRPCHAQCEQDGFCPRDPWLKAGAVGMLCRAVPEEHGGLGLDYPVARAYAAARIAKIADGPIEIMKHITRRNLVEGKKASPRRTRGTSSQRG